MTHSGWFSWYVAKWPDYQLKSVNLLAQSQRDVAAQVPINFVTNPTISLTAACFGDRSYNGVDGSLCLSNLLTIGYRRIIIDVFWSHQRRRWQLCPVTLPSKPSGSASVQHNLGPYTCDDGMGLSTIMNLLREYFRETEEATERQMLYIILNIHAARDPNAPNQPSRHLSSQELPSGGSLLGTLFRQELTPFIYTPADLRHDRSNLNESWFRDTTSLTHPMNGFFTVEEKDNGIQTTPDGWPCEAYFFTRRDWRLLVGWGSVDSQMQGYDFASDRNVIFSSNEITNHISTTVTSSGSGLQSECFFDPDKTDIGAVNASWAETNLATNLTLSYETSLLLRNATACGFSPVINVTLNGKSADVDVDPYRNLSMSSAWSWALGEPQNISILPNADSIFDPNRLFRCAVMDINSTGHWRAGNCSDEYRAACRVDGSPYSWVISDDRSEFSDAVDLCPSGTFFDVPRTGLDNSYLYQAAQTTLGGEEKFIWLNLNSLDVQYCWVLGGVNGTCVYTADAADVRRKTILIPTIAAIVILLITALTLFIKCNANRRTSRRRKRVIEGWEYEGVPS